MAARIRDSYDRHATRLLAPVQSERVVADLDLLWRAGLLHQYEHLPSAVGGPVWLEVRSTVGVAVHNLTPWRSGAAFRMSPVPVSELAMAALVRLVAALGDLFPTVCGGRDCSADWRRFVALRYVPLAALCRMR